jgi:Right handed beta helix region
MKRYRAMGCVVAVGALAAPAAAAAAGSPGDRWTTSPSRHQPRLPTARSRTKVTPARVSGTTFYVSPSGSDSSSGTSPASPWRTIRRVNRARLHRGDGVLFQGGERFSDDALMPDVSGVAGDPIVFGSYGSSEATITRGVWFVDHDYLTFDHLAFGPGAGLQGGNDNGRSAHHITVQRCTIGLSADNPAVGINANGDDWTVAGNTVSDIGNSGMLLSGARYMITNTIDHTGLDHSLHYGKHGIYLKAAHAAVTRNTISDFSDDGISARYRDSTINHNRISDGAIGIAFFQYDEIAGTSHWSHNQISGTTAAGIYVSRSDQAGPTIESFVITHNSIRVAAGQTINVQHTRGTFTTSRNSR